MRERAELLAGKLEFLKPAEGGTLVRLTVPMERPEIQTSHKISVLLVDDHALVRRGFRRMLEDESDLAVIGEASDATEAINLVKELRPNVVVMDCALPGLSGLPQSSQCWKPPRTPWC